MMKAITTSSILLFILASSVSGQLAWVGTYADPTYGGNLAVCVSQVGSTYYGQGLISSVGYLRGTIDASNVWTGNYFVAGSAAIRGNFTLTFNTGTNTYSGSYQQTGATDVVYSVSNAPKSSAATPTDEECFKADNSMLTMTTTYDITSALSYEYYTSYWYLSADDTSLTSSYTYIYADGSLSPGTTYGSIYLNGQLVLDNWYETGSAEGIELTLAKNSTHTYNLWWFTPSIADFDYSQQSVDDFASHLLATEPSISTSEIIEESVENVCYSLWTESAEQSCLSDGNDDDDSNDLDRNLLATAVAFAVATFVTVLVVLIVVILRMKPVDPVVGKEIPMASRETTNKV